MILLDKREDFLRCLRNELVPENPETGYRGYGIEGLINYWINKNIRHPDNMYMRYNKLKKKCVSPNIALDEVNKIFDGYGAI